MGIQDECRLYYDRRSRAEPEFDAGVEDVKLRRLKEEMPNSLGYLPSYKNYSVTAPEYLNPLSKDFFERKEKAKRLRLYNYKPYDTRTVLANDIMKEETPPTDRPPLLRINRFGGITDRPSVCLSKYGLNAIAEARYPAGGPPPDIAPKFSSDSYQIRAKPTWYFPSPFDKPEGDEGKRKSGDDEEEEGRFPSKWDLPLDLVPSRAPAYTSVTAAKAMASGAPRAAAAAGGGGRSNGNGGAKSIYYTDTNYPEHFWDSAPSLKDMIKE